MRQKLASLVKKQKKKRTTNSKKWSVSDQFQVLRTQIEYVHKFLVSILTSELWKSKMSAHLRCGPL